MKERSSAVIWGFIGSLAYAIAAGVLMRTFDLEVDYFLSGMVVIYFLIGFNAHSFGGFRLAFQSGAIVTTLETLITTPFCVYFGLVGRADWATQEASFVSNLFWGYVFILLLVGLGAIASKIVITIRD